MLGQWNKIIDSIMVQFLSTLLYILGANLVFDMKLSVGSVFAFITYSAYVTGPISAILNIGYLLSGIIPSTKRYYTFMELEEETDNGKKTDLCPNDLRLQKVSFVYERDKCILKNIDILGAMVRERRQSSIFLRECMSRQVVKYCWEQKIFQSCHCQNTEIWYQL